MTRLIRLTVASRLFSRLSNFGQSPITRVHINHQFLVECARGVHNRRNGFQPPAHRPSDVTPDQPEDVEPEIPGTPPSADSRSRRTWSSGWNLKLTVDKGTVHKCTLAQDFWVLSSHQGMCLSDFEQTRSVPVRDYGIPPLVGGSFLFRRAAAFLIPMSWVLKGLQPHNQKHT